MLPKDPMILLSCINTQLRDNYSDLDSLCDDKGEDPEDIKTALAAVGFEYDPELNRFK